MAETKAPKVTVVPEEELYYSTDEEKMTVDERKLYRKMARESQGFDVPRIPVEGCGQIVPLKTLRHSMENLKFCCKLAMNEYNRKKEGKRLKLVKIVKANLQVCSPMNYYITFEAKDSDGRVNEYQAMIRYRLPKEKSVVEIMRLKPEVSSSGIPDAAPSAESSKPIFNEFNARKPDEFNVFRGITKNRLFMGIVVLTLVLQVIIVEFLGKFTTTVRLNWKQWIISLVIAVISWPLALVGKLIPVSETPLSEYFSGAYYRFKKMFCCRRRATQS